MERQMEAERVTTAQAQAEAQLERRRRILDEQVAHYQREGWLLADRTDTTAQLQKRVPVFPLWLVILITVLTLGIGWLLLGLFHKTATVFIEVDEHGRLRTTRHG